MEEAFIVHFDWTFPSEDIEQIATDLMSSNCLVPGYDPPAVGLLSVAGMIYSQEIEKQNTSVLPDRNLVSRMVKVARDGIARPDDPTAVAIKLMAYCQCLNVQIEPSIAFHELAVHVGNERALDELAWFRAADKANPLAWVDLAVGRSAEPIVDEPGCVPSADLAHPLHRWRRNYIVALKIAQLELSDRPRHECMLAMLDWMNEDFILAGPASLLAMFYLSPDAARRGTFKRLRSADRERALAGIRNEAWDVTHLSDFARRINMTSDTRFMLATADKRLADLARSLVPHSGDEMFRDQAYRIAHHRWPAVHADSIAERLVAYQQEAEARPRRSFGSDAVNEWIARGEAEIRSYTGT